MWKEKLELMGWVQCGLEKWPLKAVRACRLHAGDRHDGLDEWSVSSGRLVSRAPAPLSLPLPMTRQEGANDLQSDPQDE